MAQKGGFPGREAKAAVMQATLSDSLVDVVDDRLEDSNEALQAAQKDRRELVVAVASIVLKERTHKQQIASEVSWADRERSSLASTASRLLSISTISLDLCVFVSRT
jgi:hypothetical protein